MDSGHSNEARWPNNTLLTYTLPRTVKVRESVDVRQEEQERRQCVMKKTNRGLVAVICVLAIGLACGTRVTVGADSKDSEQAIRKVLEQFVGSLEKRDAAGIKDILHTSVIFVEASGNNGHVELADQKNLESLLPPKGNDDWQGVAVSNLSITISATHPSVAVVSFLMKFKL